MNQIVPLSEQSRVLPAGHGFKLPEREPFGIQPNFERSGDSVADAAHDLMNEQPAPQTAPSQPRGRSMAI